MAPRLGWGAGEPFSGTRQENEQVKIEAQRGEERRQERPNTPLKTLKAAAQTSVKRLAGERFNQASVGSDTRFQHKILKKMNDA